MNTLPGRRFEIASRSAILLAKEAVWCPCLHQLSHCNTTKKVKTVQYISTTRGGPSPAKVAHFAQQSADARLDELRRYGSTINIQSSEGGVFVTRKDSTKPFVQKHFLRDSADSKLFIQKFSHDRRIYRPLPAAASRRINLTHNREGSKSPSKSGQAEIQRSTAREGSPTLRTGRVFRQIVVDPPLNSERNDVFRRGGLKSVYATQGTIALSPVRRVRYHLRGMARRVENERACSTSQSEIIEARTGPQHIRLRYFVMDFNEGTSGWRSANRSSTASEARDGSVGDEPGSSTSFEIKHHLTKSAIDLSDLIRKYSAKPPVRAAQPFDESLPVGDQAADSYAALEKVEWDRFTSMSHSELMQSRGGMETATEALVSYVPAEDVSKADTAGSEPPESEVLSGQASQQPLDPQTLLEEIFARPTSSAPSIQDADARVDTKASAQRKQPDRNEE